MIIKRNNNLLNSRKNKFRYKNRLSKKLRIIATIVVLLSLGIFMHNNYFSTSSKLLSSKAINTVSTFTVCLDAGHGDWDEGAIGVSGSSEKNINLSVAMKVGEILESNGVNVVYTRTNDKLTWSDNSTENLYERVNISKENNSDLFLSIHCNSTDASHSYNGVETWYNPVQSESEVFATSIQNELSNLGYTTDRGIKYYDSNAPLAVLEHNPTTSALVELGFISNVYDEDYLKSKKGQAKVAQAIAKAILNYKSMLN